MAKPEQVENAKYRKLYTVLEKVEKDGTYLALPLYEKAGQTQAQLEKNIKHILTQAHQQYEQRVQAGEAAQGVLDELTKASFEQLQKALL